MNTKKCALAIIAVIGIAIIFVVVAGAIHGNGKCFSGKEFAKMNPDIHPCMNDTAVLACKQNTDLNATGMLSCVKEAMTACREKLNLTVNAAGARFDMKNCYRGAIENFNASMKNCYRGAKGNFNARGMGFNAAGARFDMKNCSKCAGGNFSAGMGFNASGSGFDMKNCSIGARGTFSAGKVPPPRFHPMGARRGI